MRSHSFEFLDTEIVAKKLNLILLFLVSLRRLRSDLLNPKFGSQKSALL